MNRTAYILVMIFVVAYLILFFGVLKAGVKTLDNMQDRPDIIQEYIIEEVKEDYGL